jgi:small-conductance mechanosensitive channel
MTVPYTGRMDGILDTGLARVLMAAIVVALALLIFTVLWRLILRVMKDRVLARELHARCRWPARIVVALTAVWLTLPSIRLRPSVYSPLNHLLVVALVVAGAWLAERAVRVAEDALSRRLDVDTPDNLRARRARTQVRVVGRVITLGIIVLALAIVLLTFPEGRTIGASLLASAGIAGIIAGVAARSTVGNFIAGLQIAFAEPIRLDDAVVVEGEWGNVEEITLTYVVVRIWDRRRLVLPSSYFVENPIENWTRYSADIVGTVIFYVDYTTPVEEVRAQFDRIVTASKLWNGQTSILQVVDATEKTMVLRGVVSADSAPNAWDLRCEVREKTLAWLQREHPEALPRLRAELPPRPAGAVAEGAPDGAATESPAERATQETPADGSRTARRSARPRKSSAPGDST